ncbi:MAG: hypothetical protein DME69_07070 [Verrucomicrobia bacterium]|nr:MAG: hypothetical protein DME69_07070 [Verrucomicrobiota bacterium]
MTNGSSSGAFGWLGNVNNLLTTFGAIVAAIAATFSAINKAAIERVDSKVKDLTFREQKEKLSATFADVFLKTVLPDPQIKENPKHVQALLSILNIIAQASASGTGDSDAKARAIMPMHLALLMGQPGGLAAMDVDYRYVDDWVALALADDSHTIRVTAIQALTGICQKALRAGRLDVVSKGVEAVNELLALIPEDQATVRAPAVAARSQLASFITKQHQLLDAAQLPDGDRRTAENVKSEVRAALGEAQAVAQATKSTLQATYAKLEDSTKPADVKQAATVKSNIAQIDAALKTAAQVTVEKAVETAKVNTPNAPTGTDPIQSAISRIIPDLASENADKRHKARSDLALFGQSAVKLLLQEVEKRAQKNSEPDYRTRLGVALALQSMRQPVVLDTWDAYWVVSLIRSNDDNTRDATAEFLMNLESDASVRNCFDALEALFYELSESPGGTDGKTVVNIATIVGSWARNITPDTDSRDPGKPFPAFALEIAKRWQQILRQSKAKADWTETLRTLDSLIERASKSPSVPTVKALVSPP